jgi:formate hydrogenlyase subunit 3/multisubunit Na+/H+ antiporter MnhD subunit
MNALLYPIVLPFIAGIFCLFAPKKVREALALLGSLATFGLTIWLFSIKNRFPAGGLFLIDNLSAFILLAIGLFGFLIALYSLKYMAGKGRLREYYAYLLWTIGASSGAVLANNLILLLVFWGFLGLTLYLLIGMAEGQPGNEHIFPSNGQDEHSPYRWGGNSGLSLFSHCFLCQSRGNAFPHLDSGYGQDRPYKHHRLFARLIG